MFASQMAASVIGAHTSITANRLAQSTAAVVSLVVAAEQGLSPHKSLFLFYSSNEMLLQIDFSPLKSLNLIRLIIIDIISIAFGAAAQEESTLLQLNCAQYDCLSGCSKICNGSLQLELS